MSKYNYQTFDRHYIKFTAKQKIYLIWNFYFWSLLQNFVEKWFARGNIQRPKIVSKLCRKEYEPVLQITVRT